MSRLGIAGVGAYAPRGFVTAETFRDAWGQFAASGIQQVSVTDADEDTLTMAAESATDALAAAGVDAAAIEALYVGTTTPPTEEESMAARLVSVLGLEETTTTRQLTGSARAGVEAFVAGLESGLDGPILVVGTDAPRGEPGSEVEHGAGAGAGAVVLADDGDGELLETSERSVTYPGTRFRPAGGAETEELGVTEYARQAYRDAVTGAVSDLEATDVDAAAIGAPNGKLPYRVAGGLGLETETIQAGSTIHDLGDAGAATPLLGLARAFDGGAERVLVVGYGSGSEATALVVDGTPPTESRLEGTEERSYAEYLRTRGTITPGEPAGGGAYVSVPSWRRTLPQRHRLVAGQCTECGALAFPPEGACTDCGTLDSYEEVTLPGTGTVEAATVIGQGGAPPEFVEQQARSGSYVSAVVALDGPEGSAETVSTPAQLVDCDERPEIGDRVHSTIRRIYTQEGVTRYGLKLRPEGARRGSGETE
ncbi:zinc ribbon domain-containing protein [Natrarchaeobius sp. A-rgal3]|uniref:zinc ribbon domain-containing protein n=1 Tax=Natrarchaeobius versutus TaxID=1679078 RepID=UPI00350F4A6D